MLEVPCAASDMRYGRHSYPPPEVAESVGEE